MDFCKDYLIFQRTLHFEYGIKTNKKNILYAIEKVFVRPIRMKWMI